MPSSSSDGSVGGAAELGQQLRGLLAAGVVLAGQERLQACFAESACVGRAGVALKERQRDPAGQIGEQPQRSGPEPLKLGAELVAQRGPRADQVLPRAGQRPQRLGLIGIGLEHPEAVMIGAGQLAQHERVEPIGLPARHAKPIPSRRDLIGMQRQHPQTRVQQPLDQQPIRPLDRDQLHPQPDQLPAQRPHPLLVMRERRREQLLTRRISDAHIVLHRRPINPGAITHLGSLLGRRRLHSAPTTRYRCGCL